MKLPFDEVVRIYELSFQLNETDMVRDHISSYES